MMTDDSPPYTHSTTADGEGVYEQPDKKVLSARAAQEQRTRALIELLESWNAEDAQDLQEQKETWELLKRALDEL